MEGDVESIIISSINQCSTIEIERERVREGLLAADLNCQSEKERGTTPERRWSCVCVCVCTRSSYTVNASTTSTSTTTTTLWKCVCGSALNLRIHQDGGHAATASIQLLSYCLPLLLSIHGCVYRAIPCLQLETVKKRIPREVTTDDKGSPAFH